MIINKRKVISKRCWLCGLCCQEVLDQLTKTREARLLLTQSPSLNMFPELANMLSIPTSYM